MSAIHVTVTAERIAAAEPLHPSMKWADPLERALEELIGQEVDIDGGEQDGWCMATIGRGAVVLVVDLPAVASDWLDRRWADYPPSPGEPFEFDLDLDWLPGLVAKAVPA